MTHPEYDRAGVSREDGHCYQSFVEECPQYKLMREEIEKLRESIHVTADGRIGIKHGGETIVMAAKDWFRLGKREMELFERITPDRRECPGCIACPHESDYGHT